MRGDRSSTIGRPWPSGYTVTRTPTLADSPGRSRAGCGMAATRHVWIVAVTLVVSGGVLVAIGRKQGSGTLERNWLAGIRTRQTMRSDAAWHAAHTATACLTIGIGVVLLVAGAAIVVLRPANDATIATIVLGSVGVTLALAVTAGVQGHRIARQVNEGAAEDHNHDDK